MLAREHELLLSPAVCFEYEAVLKRPNHLAAVGLSSEDVELLLRVVVSVSTPIDTPFSWRPQLRDPDDEHVLTLAINGRADRLVTFNKRDFMGAADRFGLRLALPKDVLREVR